MVLRNRVLGVLIGVFVTLSVAAGGQLTGGGLTKVTTSGGILAGSGTTSSPLTATLTKDGSLAGTGSSGSPLRANLSVSSPLTGTGSSGSPLATSIQTSSPVTGTGAIGSPLTASIVTSGGILGGNGSSGSPMTATLTTTAPISGTGSAGSPLAAGTFSSGASGVVPASGGGTTAFLRADGSWAEPVGTAGINGYNGILELGSVALGTTLNNWAPTGYAGQSVITVATSTGGGTSITGINLGAYQVDGKVISIQQTGANGINYSSENVNSTTTNRILANFSSGGQFSVITLRYTNRAGGARWVQF